MEQIYKKRYGLPKSEHLVGRNNIARLYESGKKIAEQPLLAVYLPTPAHRQIRVLFAVPKKYFKRAVDRNRYKRLLREAYRLNKTSLVECVENRGSGLDMAISITCCERLSFVSVEERMIKIINILTEILNENNC